MNTKSHMASFNYTPLDLSKESIRLVKLHKSQDASEDIRCDIFEAFLDDRSLCDYHALSYCWGEKNLCCRIDMGGQQLHITANLHKALRCLREETVDVILWADAICIDQSCEGERRHQVGRMKQIYDHAQEVVIWLGTGNSRTDILMKSMKNLEREMSLTPGYRKRSPEDWKDMVGQSMYWLNSSTLDYHEHRETLQEILELDWFQRVWILQEAASAKRATVVCGSESISSWVFVLIPRLLDVSPNKHAAAVLDIMPGYSRSSSWFSEKPDLATLLLKFVSSKASDPRDRIYALLGMSSDASSCSMIGPDYKVDFAQVIQKTISYLLFRKLRDLSSCNIIHLTLEEFASLLEGPRSLCSNILHWSLEQDDIDLYKIMESEKLVDVNQSKTATGEPVLHFLVGHHTQGRILKYVVNCESTIFDIQHPCEMVSTRPPKKGFDAENHWNPEKDWNPENDWNSENDWNPENHCIPESRWIIKTIGNNPANSEQLTPLARALWNGDKDTARLLFAHGARIDAGRVYKNGMTLLFEALQAGDIDMTRLLLEHGATVHNDNAYKDGMTLLAQAVQRKDALMARLLLEHGATVYNDNDHEDGMTLLAQAVQGKDLHMVEILLEHGATVHNDNIYKDGMTLLDRAVEAGHVYIACLLLQHGATVQNNNMLDQAVQAGNVPMARLLLQHGATIHNDNVCKDGMTLLNQAVQGKDVHMAELLLQHGATVHNDNVYEDGMTLLDQAIQAEDAYMARLLHRYGATADIKRIKKHVTSMLASSVHCSDEEKIRFLLELDRDVCLDHVYENELTLLAYAAKNGRQDMVKLLLDSGAGVEARGLRDMTPLLCVVSSEYKNVEDMDADGSVQIIETLLRHGANVEARDGLNRTPLMIAASRANRAYIETLLHWGADVDSCAGLEVGVEPSDTPLAIAIRKGFPITTKLLLDHKANSSFLAIFNSISAYSGSCIRLLRRRGDQFDLKGACKKSPNLMNEMLHHATMLGKPSVMDFLLKEGAQVNFKNQEGDTGLLSYLLQVQNQYRKPRYRTPDLEVIKLLIDNGADIHAQNIYGPTPLSVAKSLNWPELHELLAPYF